MFLKLDGTFWIQIINFVVFYVLLDVVFLKRVRKAIATRRAFIDGIQSEYDGAVREIAALKTGSEAQKSANRRAIEEHFAQMRAEASNEAALITTRASALAHDRVSKAHATVTEELDGAKRRLEPLADELATSLLGRVLGNA